MARPTTTDDAASSVPGERIDGHGEDLANPSRQLPRAIYLALGIATTIYVAVALGVFGTLTVDEVISSGGTA